nr:PucR family transcriptional regulator [Leucobacter exalbidus]
MGELLHEYQLGLVLIAGVTEHTTSLPVQWVHVSELEDPTPFLTPHTVLLTTGARFDAVTEPADAMAYVQRLVDSRTTALGVAVGLHWDRVPTAIVDACDALDFPLFRVPYDTAFITISQTAVRLLDAQTRERDLWALDSQRAVVAASLHRDGLAAAVREATARLGRWVSITDRFGRLIELAPASAHNPERVERIRAEATRLLARGVSAGRIGERDGVGMRLQTLGRRGEVLGVLVVEEHGSPDSAERTLFSLVAALATVQLELRGGADEAQAAIREAVTQVIFAGDLALAQQLTQHTPLQLPENPIAVVRYDAAPATDPEFDQDLRSFDAGSRGFVRAETSARPVILTETRHLAQLRRVFAAHGVPAGISQRGAIEEAAKLAEQAERAYEHATSNDAAGPVDYRPAVHDGVLHLLGRDPEARERALSLLAPVREHDTKHLDQIERGLTVWLAHHGQFSAAATELGVHRHTLKSRIATAANLLQRDLDSPDARAELWAALRLSPGD